MRSNDTQPVPPRPFNPSAAQIAQVGNLSEMQRRCVELVTSGPSKIIGQNLGISHNTVDNYLKEACRRLGVQSRVQAAIVLAAAQALPIHDWRGQSDGVAPRGGGVMTDGPIDSIVDERPHDPSHEIAHIEPRDVPAATTPRRLHQTEQPKASTIATLRQIAEIALILAIVGAAAVSIGTGFNAIGNFINTNIRHH